MTVRGAGTGNYGQCVPLHGGVSLDMSGLNRVLELADGWARVEAGIIMFDLNEAARKPVSSSGCGPARNGLPRWAAS